MKMLAWSVLVVGAVACGPLTQPLLPGTASNPDCFSKTPPPPPCPEQWFQARQLCTEDDVRARDGGARLSDGTSCSYPGMGDGPFEGESCAATAVATCAETDAGVRCGGCAQ